MITQSYRIATRYADGRVGLSPRVFFDRADIDGKVERMNEGERQHGGTVHFVKVFKVGTTTGATR